MSSLQRPKQSKMCSGEDSWTQHFEQESYVFLLPRNDRLLMCPLASLVRAVEEPLSLSIDKAIPGFLPIYQWWVGGTLHSATICSFFREYNSWNVRVDDGGVGWLHPSFASLSATSKTCEDPLSTKTVLKYLLKPSKYQYYAKTKTWYDPLSIRHYCKDVGHL